MQSKFYSQKEKSWKNFIRFVNREYCNKIFENKKKLLKVNNEKHNFREGRKFLLVKAWHHWISPLASNVESWGVKYSFIPAIAEMEYNY